MSLRCRNSRLRNFYRCLLLLSFVLLLWYFKFAVRHQITLDDFKEAFMKSDNFLAATRTNRGKISPGSWVCVVDPAVTDCTDKGFAAFLLYTLDQIIVCQALGSDRPVVFWRACYSACSQDPKMNSWDWYFEPVNRGLESQVEKVLCPLYVGKVADSIFDKLILDKSFKKRTDVGPFKQGLLITERERLRTNKLIQQYVKPKDGITRKVSRFYQQLLAGNTVLGVHVRGTDHWIETSEKRLPSLMSWVKSAQSILETLPRPRKIFVATDNDEVIEKFVAFFGIKTVVFTKAVRAKRYHSKIAPHHYEFEHHATHPYERVMGTQVLLDILLLAKCDHFLHAESSVASLATYFNPNMTSIFMEPGRDIEEKGKIRTKRRIHERIRRIEPEEEQERHAKDLHLAIYESLKCLQKNSATSPCPNAAEGNFVYWDETQSFLKANKAD